MKWTKREKKFHKEMFAITEKYPECVIEAWTPTDFQEVVDNWAEEKEITKQELTEDECLGIANTLNAGFDANQGINWDVLNMAVESNVERYD